MAQSQTVTMAKPKIPVTKKPGGVGIARNGANFTASWKISDDDYGDGQGFGYRVQINGKWKSWVSDSIGKTKTSHGIKLTRADYYPTTKTKLTAVEFRVRGNRKKYKNKEDEYVDPTVSEWNGKEFKVKIPNKPSLTVTRQTSNVCRFTWSVKADANIHEWAYDVEWQSKLIQNCNETNGEKAWKLTGSSVLNGTNTNLATYRDITEDTATLSGKSYTRWFRIRARGPAGATAWVYAKHVYSASKAATGTKASATATASGITVKAEWSAPADAAHPISETTVQYAIAVPAAGLTCPAGASWQEAKVSADTGGKDAAAFQVGESLDLDECLFIRVNTEWDSATTYGEAKLAKIGKMKKPTALSVTADDTTFRATIRATNESDVPDSFLVVTYKTGSGSNEFPIGIIPHGSSSVTVQCPEWSTTTPKSFSVYAAQGSYTALTRADGVTAYAVTAKMRSDVTTDGGSVPLAPDNVALALTDVPGTVRVTFDWTWTEATAAELSWADHDDAWESTDEPEVYVINSLHAAKWNISGLATGRTWYVRVRLMSAEEENVTYGSYSPIMSIDLSSAPAVAEMVVDNGTITSDDMVTAAWTYVSNDGTGQAYAEVAELIDGEYVPITHTQTAQHVDILAEAVGWDAGETHLIAVRCTSASGNVSSWSDTVPVSVVVPLTITITSDSLVARSYATDNGVTKHVNALTVMPLTVTVTGAGEAGITTVAIERAETYQVDRPDESERYGFEGETIALITQVGESAVEISNDDLIGRLDDGAQYKIVATISDGFGQSAEATKDFEVHWDHQAAAPTATVEIDEDEMIAKLTPTAPAGAAATDVCDIYRLSVDKPVLIYPGAAFGSVYVDPYPAIGEFGGYRFVTRTENNDYITPENQMAWIDVDDEALDVGFNIIDFGTGRVMLLYEIDLSSQWKKDFTETKYLGGAIQGDWNPAVSRSASISGVAVRTEDQNTIEQIRRLAVWPGICHVRTKDGSSYAADVQVKEDYKQSNAQTVVYFTLTITRVDTEEYDGVTLAEWEETHTEE